MTTFQRQYYAFDDEDKDSICNELVYPPDGGFYSDAECGSPGLIIDQSKAPKAVFNPIMVPESSGKQEVLTVNRRGPYTDCVNTHTTQQQRRVLTNKASQKTVKNIDSFLNKQQFTPSARTVAKQQQGSRSPRHSKIKSYIENSGFFYVPGSSSLTMQQKPSPHMEPLTKDDNVSPVTISSGYSSDKDDAMRQLELDYVSDENPSPMHKALDQMSPFRHSVGESDGFTIKADELYDKSIHYDDSVCYQEELFDRISGDIHTLDEHVASHFTTRGVSHQTHSCKKSKDSYYNRRNSIAANPYHVTSLFEINDSLSSLSIKSNECPKLSYTENSKCKAIKKRAVSTASNVCGKDVEKLPEILPAGVRTSYTTSSGILMAPEASTNCRRCFSFTTSPAVKSPSSDLSHFRVSKDSAFRPVKTSSPRSNSTPLRHRDVTASLDVFRQRGVYEQQYISMGNPHNSSHLLMSPNGSRVTSLSDSGRGSASSIDLALNDLPPLSYDSSVFSDGGVSHEIVPIYQDIPKEQVYETVPEVVGERYCNVTMHATPPKLPKRNARSAHRTPRSERKAALVQYEDIVKPQDIVDPSAMHMYTVADVLKSVDRLSSDIPQQSNEMCIHDDFAHFVFGNTTPCNSLQRSTSHSSLREGPLELSIASSRTSAQNDSYDSSVSSPRGVRSNLALPIRPHQNTACEAQTKRLPKIKDTPNNICSSPCLSNKVRGKPPRDHKQCAESSLRKQTLKSLPKRTVSCVGNRGRSHSLSRSQGQLADSTIAWSPRDSLNEIYC